MRNLPKPLSPADASIARMRKAALSEQTGPVGISYVKRDGQVSSSTGTVAFFNGDEDFDTMSVVLDTPDKGHRTINIARITNIWRPL